VVQTEQMLTTILVASFEQKQKDLSGSDFINKQKQSLVILL
jgi:hypothetical protein